MDDNIKKLEPCPIRNQLDYDMLIKQNYMAILNFEAQ